jgi:hypothetical protein
MAIPIEEILPSVPIGWIIFVLFFFSFPAGAYALYYIAWIYLPRRWKWIIRGEEGFCYTILDGEEEDDPETRGAQGPAAGRKTNGGFRYYLLVFKNHCIDKETGDIVIGKSDDGILGRGIYLIGFFTSVVEIIRERWAEVKGGTYRERMVVRRGFSVQFASAAYKVNVLDEDNFSFEILGMIIRAPCNPDKARRLTRDVDNIILEIIRGEWISFAKGRQIYRPKINLGDALCDGLSESGIKPVATKEIDSSKLMDDFKKHIMSKVFEYEPIVVEKAEAVSQIPYIPLPFYKKKVFSYKKGPAKKGPFLDMVRDVYGIEINRWILDDVKPGKEFVKALSAAVEAQLMGVAELVAAYYSKMATLEKLKASKAVGAAIDESPGVLTGQFVEALKDKMPEMLVDLGALRMVMNQTPSSDVLATDKGLLIARVIEEIEARKKGEYKENTDAT